MEYRAVCTNCNNEVEFYDPYDAPEGVNCDHCGMDGCLSCLIVNDENEQLCEDCFEDYEYNKEVEPDEGTTDGGGNEEDPTS